MVGRHLIKAWSTTQSTLALSSGEAELTGIVKGASQAIGLRSVAKDLGIKWDIEIRTDATAAIGICRRKGLGKIRHLAVADLWVQDKVKSGDFALSKILGSDNPADLLTKYLDGSSIVKHAKRIEIEYEGGRADSAPALPKSELPDEDEDNPKECLRPSHSGPYESKPCEAGAGHPLSKEPGNSGLPEETEVKSGSKRGRKRWADESDSNEEEVDA